VITHSVGQGTLTGKSRNGLATSDSGQQKLGKSSKRFGHPGPEQVFGGETGPANCLNKTWKWLGADMSTWAAMSATLMGLIPACTNVRINTRQIQAACRLAFFRARKTTRSCRLIAAAPPPKCQGHADAWA